MLLHWRWLDCFWRRLRQTLAQRTWISGSQARLEAIVPRTGPGRATAQDGSPMRLCNAYRTSSAVLDTCSFSWMRVLWPLTVFTDR